METRVVRCDIVARAPNYVTFFEVYNDGDRIYRFSDRLHNPTNDELRDYSRRMKIVNANDPFVGRAVHGG